MDQEIEIYENLRQEHGSNIYVQENMSSTKWARRDAESTTTINTTGTGDSGISEWIASRFTSCDMHVHKASPDN